MDRNAYVQEVGEQSVHAFSRRPAQLSAQQPPSSMGYQRKSSSMGSRRLGALLGRQEQLAKWTIVDAGANACGADVTA